MRPWRCRLGATFLAAAASAVPLSAQNPHRQGFWFEAGAGPARMRIACAGCPGVTVSYGEGGYGRFGWTMSPKILMAIEGYGFNDDNFRFTPADSAVYVDNAAVSAIVLWYPWRRTHFFLKGGAGLSVGSYTLMPDTGQAVIIDALGAGLTFGFGLDVPVHRKWAVTGNAQLFINGIGDIVLPGRVVDDPIPTIYTVNLGVTYR